MVRMGRRRAIGLGVVGVVGNLNGYGQHVVTDVASGTGDVCYTVLDHPPATSPPAWYREDETATGHVTVIDDEDRLQAIDRGQDGIADVLADADVDVDFEETVVLLLESVGPTACYTELIVENLALAEGALVGSARATEGEAEDDIADVCAQVLTFPAALVVATVDGDPPTVATIEVTDGREATDTITATADDPLPSPRDDEGADGRGRPGREGEGEGTVAPYSTSTVF